MSERATAPQPATDETHGAGRTRQMFALPQATPEAPATADVQTTTSASPARKTRPMHPTPAPAAPAAIATADAPAEDTRPAGTRRLGACVRKQILGELSAAPAAPTPEASVARTTSEPSAARKTVARLEAIAPAPGATMGRAYGGSTAKTVQMRVEELAAFHPRQRAQLEDGRTQQLSAVLPASVAQQQAALPVHLLVAAAIALLVLVACAFLGLCQLL